METLDEHQVLKDLALDFDVSGNPVVFAKILLKIDGFLKYHVHRIVRTHPYLRNVEFYDLYQTAILGLYLALAKVKENEPGCYLLQSILRKMEDEIYKAYKNRSKNITFESFEDVIQRELVDNSKVYADLERQFIRDRFRKLINVGVISEDEFDILKRHCVDGMSFRSIARQDGCAIGTISKKVRDSLNRLRFEFRRRHWEEG